jgi:hypothetical protein
VRVDFTVTGANPTSGFANTNASGVAEFCYTGANEGSDTITGAVGTLSDTASKTWTTTPPEPPGVGCKVTGGARITVANGDKATFGGNADPSSPPKGQEQYTDHGPATPIKVHSLSVLSISCSSDRTEAAVTGKATINGGGSFDYRIDVKDLGEPGSNDRYRIRLSNGYDSGEQKLQGGNIQIHK